MMSVKELNLKRNNRKLSRVAGKTEPEAVLCEDCGKTLSCPSSLRSHRFIVHGVADEVAEEKILECPYCDRKEFTQARLKDHILARHEDYRPCKCPECSYRSNAFYTLKTHFRLVHKRNIERRFLQVHREGYPGRPYVIFDKDTGEEMVTFLSHK
jgi:hypothetical protein